MFAVQSLTRAAHSIKQGDKKQKTKLLYQFFLGDYMRKKAPSVREQGDASLIITNNITACVEWRLAQSEINEQMDLWL